MPNYTNLKTPVTPTWCPGCGDFGIWTAFKMAAQQEKWDDTNTFLTAGIGCHGHILNYLRLTSFEGLHGRDLALASGVKLAQPNLNVFSFTGDGNCLSEGGNHFIHTARRNHNITVVLHDNAIYGLTTGQTSPRTPKGMPTRSNPEGAYDEPLNPLATAIAVGATFVARCYSGDIEYLAELFIKANNHRGFALIDVLQPCVTFNKVYSHFFYQKSIYRLPEDFDKTNKTKAFEKSLEWAEGSIPTGIFYEVNLPTAEEHFTTPKIETRNLSNLFKRLG